MSLIVFDSSLVLISAMKHNKVDNYVKSVITLVAFNLNILAFEKKISNELDKNDQQAHVSMIPINALDLTLHLSFFLFFLSLPLEIVWIVFNET